MSCSGIIFWYTGAFVWAIIGCGVAAAVIMSTLYGFFTGYRQARKYAFTYLVCKRMGVDRDLEFTWRVRRLASELLIDINRGRGLHIREVNGNDLALVMNALEEFSTRDDKHRL